MKNELDPNMSILDYVEDDVHHAAWSILEFALASIERGVYQRNGMLCLTEISKQILQNNDVPPPEWVREIRAILEKNKKDEYEWSNLPAQAFKLPCSKTFG